MEIYLVRHTRVAVGRTVCYGQTDVALADNYEAEREVVRAKLALPPHHDWATYTSPLTRCQRLARDLSAAVRLDPRLQELHFGDWENRPWTDLPPHLLDPWMADFVNQPAPNGESFLELQRRAVEFWDELLVADHPQVLVCTHAGVIRCLLCHCLGLPLQHAFRLAIDYGSVSRITQHGGRLTVDFINR